MRASLRLLFSGKIWRGIKFADLARSEVVLSVRKSSGFNCSNYYSLVLMRLHTRIHEQISMLLCVIVACMCVCVCMCSSDVCVCVYLLSIT